MSGPGLRPLPFGELPTRKALNLVLRKEHIPAPARTSDEVLEVMRQLKRDGDLATLRLLLFRCGFCWPSPDAEVSP